MKISKLGKSLLASAVSLTALAAFTPSAGAVGTTATFALTGGAGLAVTAPATATLGGGATTGTATTPAQLGNVVVSDTRGALAGTWTAKASSSSFTTTGEGAPAIAATNVSYWSGASISPTGTAVRTPGQLLEAAKVTLDAERTAFSAAGVIGNGTTTWNPTLAVAIPEGVVAGTYTGTITHSVA